MTINKKHSATRLQVQRAYGNIAKTSTSCCSGSSCCGGSAPAPTGVDGELGLSCGSPVAFSKIKKGMTVLDLGSGAGKDVFIAAPLTGPEGKVIGVDMTPEMLKLAAENLVKFTARTGLKNVEFRKGLIEKLPVKNGEADLVISNCVVNLSPDKPVVFREAFRALKPGGFMVVSDIVLNRELPPALKEDADLYTACVAGALLRQDYLGAIKAAGFDDIKLLTDNTSPIGDTSGISASSITVYARRSK